MVEQFNGILKALGNIPGLQVLRTSEALDDARVRLPTAVLDFEPCAFEGYGESTGKFFISPSYSLELHIERQPHKPEADHDNAISLFSKALIEILRVYPQGLAIKDLYTAPAILGKQETLVCALLIELRKMKFNLPVQ